MAAVVPPQDLPPKGGYFPITFKRVPAKSIFRPWQLVVGHTVMSLTALYLFYKNYKTVKRHMIEMQSSRLAVTPILAAERDRAVLKLIIENRIEEEKLMADVENWEVGTLYGEPIYKTVDPNRFYEPMKGELFVHGPNKTLCRNKTIHLWT